MRAIEVEKRLADLAAGQWGLVTTPQAIAQGVTHSQLNRLAEQEVITRLSHGVYQLRSAPTDHHIDLRAAWLALTPKLTAGQRLRNLSNEPIVSHASAASLRGWGDLTAYDSEFTFDGRKQTRRDGVRIHRGATPKTDVEIVNGLPTTTAERLIADLLAADYDTDHIGDVLAGAIRDRSIDLERLAKRTAPYARRRGFNDLAGSELVAAIVRSGGAEDEAAADSLVRLAKISTPQGSTASLAAVREAMAFQQYVANFSPPDTDATIRAALEQSTILQQYVAKFSPPETDATIRAALEQSTILQQYVAKFSPPKTDATIRAVLEQSTILQQQLAPTVALLAASNAAAEIARGNVPHAIAGEVRRPRRIVDDPAAKLALPAVKKRR